MKKQNKLSVLFLLGITIAVNAQISTGAGASSVLANSPTTNTNVGIGTTNPIAKLDIAGGLSDGQTFTSNTDRNYKTWILNVGSIVNPTTGSRLLKFLDFPVSNINAKSMFWFAIDDRKDNQRFRVYAETGGYGGLEVNDNKQRNVFKIVETTSLEGCSFSHVTLPQSDTRMIIGSAYEGLTDDVINNYKFVVKNGKCNGTYGLGSALVEGNIVSMSNIGIGTSNFVDGIDTYRLSVKGKIRAQEIKVYNTWADYVFKKEYKLPTLNEVEKYIIQNGHLPNVPSAQEITKKGLELGEMAKIQQEKIEELTLYIIEQNKRIEKLEAVLRTLVK